MNAGRVAFVTGASTGLGNTIACALGREGYDLAVTDLVVGMFDTLLRGPALAGRKIVPLRVDLRNESDIVQAFAACVARRVVTWITTPTSWYAMPSSGAMSPATACSARRCLAA